MSHSALASLIRLALSGQYPSVDNGGYEAVATMSMDWMRSKGVPLRGMTVLDLGGGTGVQARCLAQSGARVIVTDMRRFPVDEGCHRICCDILRLGLGKGSVDVVYCSNVLEHIPPTLHRTLFDEMSRVLTAGGYVYLSWGNWLSPFGGHEHSPFHYLGSWGMTMSQRRRTRQGRQVIHQLGINLFRTRIGDVIREVEQMRPELCLLDVVPRYWPWLGFICRVPWAREFLTWNCVLLLQKARG
jgi:SAM-dependent methyltransferase